MGARTDVRYVMTDDTTRQHGDDTAAGVRPSDARRAERHRQVQARVRERSASEQGERAAVWMRWKPLATRLGIGLAAVLVLLIAVETAASAGKVHPGVRVAGVSLGGMSQDRATEVVSEELGSRVSAPVTVRYEEQAWSVEASAVAASVDTTAVVESAMGVGRSGGFGVRIAERARAWFGGVDVDPVVVGDPAAVQIQVDRLAGEIGRAPRDATIVIEGTTPRIEPSLDGLAVQEDTLGSLLLRGFASLEREIDAPVEPLPVTITDESAQEALANTRTLLAGPVTVTHGESSWDFSADQIAGWIAFRAVPADSDTATASAATTGTGSGSSADTSSGPDQPAVSGEMKLAAFISADEASATIADAVGETSKPAVDATFKVSSGTVSVVPSQDGTGPDVAALANDMTLTLLKGGERRVELRTTRVEPDRTTQEAQAMGIKERISTYTTEYAASNKPRVNNIHTLADALDGTLIPPGGTFSFNGTIGERTAAKGYQEAPAIVNGELVPQLGGGICQVGTTIFNTVFESGLPVVERHNHSVYISHYPKGRDATVSWGGPDFKFKNDTSTWVLIATGYSNSSLTISLYGTDPGYEVSAQTGSWTNIKAHAVKEVPDPTKPVGARVVEERGVDGRTIVVTRIVKKNGQVVREDDFRSVYRPEQEVVRVGTAPATTVPTETAAPTTP